MRTLVGLFGSLCGVVVVALVARFAYATADTPIDGVISAFLYGTVALGGLGGHAVAVRLFPRNKTWSVLIGMISVCALLVNLTNSVGAIAGRSDHKSAERQKQIDATKNLDDELKRLRKERIDLGAFAITSADAADAARAEVDAAVKRAVFDCERRYLTCRQQQATEQERRAALTQVMKDRAATERAEKIETEITRVHKAMSAARPVQHVNPQANALSRILRLPESETETAIYVQYLAIAIVVELLIVGALVCYELLPTEMEETVMEQREPVPAQVGSLVTGDVGKFVVERLSPAPGATLAIGKIFQDYATWCCNNGSEKVSEIDFQTWFSTVGKSVGLELATHDDELVCRDIALV